MNTPVSFPIAKLLKEKGYDRPTLLCYDKCDILSSYVETVFKPKNYNTSGYVKSAPTIADVVMWLYEKHGIWISINREVIGSDEWEYSYTISYLPKEYKNYKRRSTHLVKIQSFIEGIGFYTGAWDSPNLAYEAAIEYSLTNLI